MFFIIVGCGRVGSELSYDLYKRGHQVTVIDFVGASFQHLGTRGVHAGAELGIGHHHAAPGKGYPEIGGR